MGKEIIINLDTLHEICGEEKPFIIEMIDLFLQQADVLVNDIMAATENKDCEQLKKKAHKFKSSAQIFGIQKLFDILLLIENEGMQGISAKKKKNLLIELKEISDNACCQLKEERQKYV